MSEKSCLHFNENLDICYDYPNKNIKSEQICVECSDVNRQVKNNIGFLVKHNMIKTYFDKKTAFIYKRYLCPKKEYLIIGIALQLA